MAHDIAALSLAAAVHARNSIRAAEVAEIVGLVDAADHYRLLEDASLPRELQLRPVRTDRAGVVGPCEAMVAEAAAAMGMSFGGMKAKLSTALSMRIRHPRMWELFTAGAVDWWVAKEVEEASKDLTVDGALEVDKHASHSLGLNSFRTMLDQVPVWVANADRDAAAERAEWAKQERFVHVGRFEDGNVGVYGRVAAEDGVIFDAAIEQIAQSLPAPEVPEELSGWEAQQFVRGQRRAAAFGIFARQAIGQDSLMDVELVVHVPAQAPTDTADDNDAQPPLGAMAEVEGWGKLLTESLPEFLSGSKVTVKPVLDPNMISEPAGRVPSSAQKLAVKVRNPRSVFPYATTAARHCDIDHTVTYDPTGRQGRTVLSNLGPLDRTAHRLKTAGHWKLTQPEPEVFHWRSPLGYEYVVTGQGSVMTHMPDIPVAPIPDLPPQPPPPGPPPESPPPERR